MQQNYISCQGAHSLVPRLGCSLLMPAYIWRFTPPLTRRSAHDFGMHIKCLEVMATGLILKPAYCITHKQYFDSLCRKGSGIILYLAVGKAVGDMVGSQAVGAVAVGTPALVAVGTPALGVVAAEDSRVALVVVGSQPVTVVVEPGGDSLDLQVVAQGSREKWVGHLMCVCTIAHKQL